MQILKLIFFLFIAENLAKQFNVLREEQDIFAVKSQQKTEAAMKNNDFKQEILPIVVQSRNGSKVVSEDEFPRHGCTLEALSKLNPCFVKVRIKL